MTERLSDERLRELCDPVPKAMPAAEVPAMASELLELRAKLAAGPVMPELLPQSAFLAMCHTPDGKQWLSVSIAKDFWSRARTVLLKEQPR